MFMIDNEKEMPLDEPYDNSIKEIAEKLCIIERSQSFLSDNVNNRTHISENEIKELFDLKNNNEINCLSSKHDKNSINSQNNNGPRYFTKTKENFNCEKYKIFSIIKQRRKKEN